MEWRIGCSGFHYKEWKEFFYPEGLPQTKWFEYYNQQFDTLESNVTFYRFPRLSLFNDWYQKSPPGFLFSVKAPRLITHYKKFNDCKSLLHDFYTTCSEGLKEKLGPVLFQLPPTLPYSPEKLDRIIESLDPSFINVIEFRDASWWNKEVWTRLRKHKLFFCSISYPKLPNDVIATGKYVYYRFHGVPRLYVSTYRKSFLDKTIAEIRKTRALVAFLYFDNTTSDGAIKNAGYVKKSVGQTETHV